MWATALRSVDVRATMRSGVCWTSPASAFGGMRARQQTPSSLKAMGFARGSEDLSVCDKRIRYHNGKTY
jgi:hypothetical protein